MSCDKSEILISSPNFRYGFIVTKIYREIFFFFLLEGKDSFLATLSFYQGNSTVNI